MKYGIHLRHAGEQATPALIRRDAERAKFGDQLARPQTRCPPLPGQ
jgi:hypothetical protein